MVFTIVLGGDVNVQHREQPQDALAGIRPVLDAADVRLVNLEGLLVPPSVDSRRPDIAHKPNWQHSGPAAVTALIAAHIDAVSCANNVSYPPDRLVESLEVLGAAGIGHAGGGATAAAAHAPAVLERGGLRLGLLAYSSIVFPYGHAAESTSPGVAALRVHTSYVPDPRIAEVPGRPPVVLTRPWPEDVAQLREDVAAARANCDLLIVSVHWGLPGDVVCDYQPVLARAALDAGADLIMGHGPHSIHGVDLHDGKPILYSLGNLAFDWPVMRDRHRDGLLAVCTVELGRIGQVELHPVTRDEDNNITIARGATADAILGRVQQLSAVRSRRRGAAGGNTTLVLRTGHRRVSAPDRR